MENTSSYRKFFVWSGALRIYHWAFTLSIITLIVTGLYIHDPQTTTTWGDYSPSYLMLTLREIHFIAGFFFIAAMLVRLYLLIFGNRFEKPTNFLPFSLDNLRALKDELRFKFYLTDKVHERPGHTILAGITYSLLYLSAMIMIISGLYMLYPEGSLSKKLGALMFGDQQMARFIHYILLYFFSLFVMVHLYTLVWTELRAGGGLISSIFSGYKFFKSDEIKSGD